MSRIYYYYYYTCRYVFCDDARKMLDRVASGKMQCARMRAAAYNVAEKERDKDKERVTYCREPERRQNFKLMAHPWALCADCAHNATEGRGGSCALIECNFQP